MKVGTDFSGIGAPEMALKYLGIDFESVFACEIDKYARQSFKQLHKPNTFYNDITTRNHNEVEELDLYVAGFPCQAFSMAGKRKGFEEARGTLFFNVAEFIQINQPKVFVLENVKGLLSHDKGNTFQTIVDILSNGGGTQNGQISLDVFEDGLGYHIYWQVLNTKDYGIPQNRERIFIVGFKDFREFSFPKPIDLKLRLGDMLQDNPNSKYFLTYKGIENLNKNQEFNKFNPLNTDSEYAACVTARCNKVSNDNNFIEVDDKYYLSDKTINRISNSRNKTKFKNQDSEYSGCLIAEYGKIPSDGTYIRTHYLGGRKGNPKKGGTGHLSKNDGTTYCLDTSNTQAIEVIQLNKSKESGGAQPYQQNRLYDINGLSPVLSAELGGNRSHNINTKKIRRLTPLECWRLQGFRDEDFFSVKDVSDTQLYKQAGNSITVNVLMELFKKIYANDNK
jgi:DNA (cytosine-5)-methyltransferase 1